MKFTEEEQWINWFFIDIHLKTLRVESIIQHNGIRKSKSNQQLRMNFPEILKNKKKTKNRKKISWRKSKKLKNSQRNGNLWE